MRSLISWTKNRSKKRSPAYIAQAHYLSVYAYLSLVVCYIFPKPNTFAQPRRILFGTSKMHSFIQTIYPTMFAQNIWCGPAVARRYDKRHRMRFIQCESTYNTESCGGMQDCVYVVIEFHAYAAYASAHQKRQCSYAVWWSVSRIYFQRSMVHMFCRVWPEHD